MSKTKLPDHEKRVSLCISICPAAVAMLDACIAKGHAATRSRVAETAIMEWFAMSVKSKPKARSRAA